TRAVISHREVRPFVCGDNLLCLHFESITRPEMNEAEGRTPVLEQQLVSAAPRISPGAGAVKNDGTFLVLARFKPKTKAEGAGAVESASVFTDDRVVSAEFERLTHLAFHLLRSIHQQRLIGAHKVRSHVISDFFKRKRCRRPM